MSGVVCWVCGNADTSELVYDWTIGQRPLPVCLEWCRSDARQAERTPTPAERRNAVVARLAGVDSETATRLGYPCTPTPEETTVTDTPASTEAEMLRLRTFVVETIPHADTGCVFPDQPCSCRAAELRRSVLAGLLALPAPDPAPRVLVDEADLRAVPLHERLTEQERADLDLVLRMSAYDGHDGLEQYDRLRSALSAASPGGEQ